MERRKSAAVFFLVMGLLLLILVVLSIAGHRRTSQGEESAVNIPTCLPDADVREVSESKSDAIAERRTGRNSNIEAYYDSVAVRSADSNEDPLKSIGGESPSGTPSASTGKSQQELFGTGHSPAASCEDRSGQYRESADQREERHRRRREEAIDMASELSGMQSSSNSERDTEPDRIDLTMEESHAVRQSGVISSLSGTGGGVSSLGKPSGTFSVDSEHPFRCVFPKQEKVKSGQRVSVRLMEDMIVGAFVIPKNTHLQAYVTIDSRLELEVNSIELSGQILPLACVAYDTDGMKGIYCPEVAEIKKTVRTSGLGTVGSLVGGRVGRVAGEVVNTGVSLAQSASGERTVTIPSGYTFFIVKKKTQ